jgi:predicted phage terminase large subunit-like protein
VFYGLLVEWSYRPNAFHRFLAGVLERAVGEGRGRIIVEAPPQHGKSLLISRLLPAWILGRFPHWPIIAASYGDDLVDLNGGAVRHYVTGAVHRAVFPDCALDGASTAKTDFRTTAGGQYLGVTIRGGGTGFPAKVFIIDDPFKSRAEADSDAFRRHVQDWYRAVVYPRLSADSLLVVMHTRWHQDDLAGWLQHEHAQEDWTVIHLPALAEDNDALGRAPGAALVPERFGVAALDKIRVAVGSREWTALYQGRPSPPGGGVFRKDWLRHYDRKDVMRAVWAMNRYVIVDPARTQKKTSDFTAMVVVGLHVDGNHYLIDAVYDRLNLKQRAETLIALHRQWKPLITGYKKIGAEADLDYMTEAQSRENYRFTVQPLAEVGAKEARIERLAPDFEASRWWLPDTLWKTDTEGSVRELVAQFVDEEYLAFPAGRHDDFFDALSGIKDLPVRWPRAERSARHSPDVLIV